MDRHYYFYVGDRFSLPSECEYIPCKLIRLEHKFMLSADFLFSPDPIQYIVWNIPEDWLIMNKLTEKQNICQLDSIDMSNTTLTKDSQFELTISDAREVRKQYQLYIDRTYTGHK